MAGLPFVHSAKLFYIVRFLGSLSGVMAALAPMVLRCHDLTPVNHLHLISDIALAARAVAWLNFLDVGEKRHCGAGTCLSRDSAVRRSETHTRFTEGLQCSWLLAYLCCLPVANSISKTVHLVKSHSVVTLHLCFLRCLSVSSPSNSQLITRS